MKRIRVRSKDPRICCGPERPLWSSRSSNTESNSRETDNSKGDSENDVIQEVGHTVLARGGKMG